MSFAKRLMEREEARAHAAISIALNAKVLRQCEFHPDIVLSTDVDITNAYRVGNAKFSAAELGTVFDSRQQMTDVVKSVVEDHLTCPYTSRFSTPGLPKVLKAAKARRTGSQHQCCHLRRCYRNHLALRNPRNREVRATR